MSGSGLVLGTPAGSLTGPSSQSQGGDTLPDGEICRWPFICVTSDAALAVFGRKCTHSESCSPASPFSTPGPTSWPRSCAWEGVRAQCCGLRSWLSFEMVPLPSPSALLSLGPGDRGYLYFSAAMALALDVGRPVWENLISAWINLSPHLS